MIWVVLEKSSSPKLILRRFSVWDCQFRAWLRVCRVRIWELHPKPPKTSPTDRHTQWCPKPKAGIRLKRLKLGSPVAP